jgi:hypothetical protein
MAEPDLSKFELPAGVIKIAFLPLAVIVVSSLLIMLFGTPFSGDNTLPFATGHLEAAARLKMLAAWLLLTAATLACLAYFARTSRAFASGTTARLTRAYFWFALFGVAAVLSGTVHGGPRFFGEPAICHALAGSWDPGRLREWLELWPSCTGIRFTMLWWLNETQKIGLALLTPALVLGTISCLAMPEPAGRDACRFQARRLSMHLYLAAAVLVIGLLFLSALLRWPASGLAGDPASAYTAHVDAYIFFWGATYSVLIASYYVPVAIGLTRTPLDPQVSPAKPKARAKARAAGDTDDDDSPISDLFSWFKTIAALFAPAIAGLLGGVLHL